MPTLRAAAATATNPNTPQQGTPTGAGGVLNPLQQLAATGSGAVTQAQTGVGGGPLPSGVLSGTGRLGSHDSPRTTNNSAGIELGSVLQSIPLATSNTHTSSRSNAQYSRLAQGSSHGLADGGSIDAAERS